MAIRAIWRRRPRARWLGLPVALGLFLFCIEWLDGLFSGIADQAVRFTIVPVLLAWWALALAFSTQARRYFGIARRCDVSAGS
jgi:hypothetical protein